MATTTNTYRLAQEVERAVGLIEQARQTLEAAEVYAGNDFGHVNTLRGYRHDLLEIVTSDEGEAGLRAYGETLQAATRTMARAATR